MLLEVTTNSSGMDGANIWTIIGVCIAAASCISGVFVAIMGLWMKSVTNSVVNKAVVNVKTEMSVQKKEMSDQIGKVLDKVEKDYLSRDLFKEAIGKLKSDLKLEIVLHKQTQIVKDDRNT